MDNCTCPRALGDLPPPCASPNASPSTDKVWSASILPLHPCLKLSLLPPPGSLPEPSGRLPQRPGTSKPTSGELRNLSRICPIFGVCGYARVLLPVTFRCSSLPCACLVSQLGCKPPRGGREPYHRGSPSSPPTPLPKTGPVYSGGPEVSSTLLTIIDQVSLTVNKHHSFD